jgi:hypothetical protein
MPDVRVSAINGAVRLTMAAKVANDLGALQKGLKSLAERMGHPACATGCDILHLATEREFTLGSGAVELNPQPLPPRSDALAAPADRTVSVAISSRVSGDINALTKAAGVVLGKLGCQACCSGYDILFRRELDFIALDDDLKAQGFGRFR